MKKVMIALLLVSGFGATAFSGPCRDVYDYCRSAGGSITTCSKAMANCMRDKYDLEA